ncbi:MAG: hypothetical protein ACI4DT_06760 [Chordicoccus sp.]
MLSLEELFKKDPFIYFIDNVYYAFGTGVCARCNSHGREYIGLPRRYNTYTSLLKEESVDYDSAWKAYRHLVSIAETVRDQENDRLHLTEKFAALQFSDEDKAEIEHQLDQLVEFFEIHHLADYPCD